MQSYSDHMQNLNYDNFPEPECKCNVVQVEVLKKMNWKPFRFHCLDCKCQVIVLPREKKGLKIDDSICLKHDFDGMSIILLDMTLIP